MALDRREARASSLSWALASFLPLSSVSLERILSSLKTTSSAKVESLTRNLHFPRFPVEFLPDRETYEICCSFVARPKKLIYFFKKLLFDRHSFEARFWHSNVSYRTLY